MADYLIGVPSDAGRKLITFFSDILSGIISGQDVVDANRLRPISTRPSGSPRRFISVERPGGYDKSGH